MKRVIFQRIHSCLVTSTQRKRGHRVAGEAVENWDPSSLHSHGPSLALDTGRTEVGRGEQHSPWAPSLLHCISLSKSPQHVLSSSETPGTLGSGPHPCRRRGREFLECHWIPEGISSEVMKQGCAPGLGSVLTQAAV